MGEPLHVAAHVFARFVSELGEGDDVLGRHVTKSEVDAARSKVSDLGQKRDFGALVDALHAVKHAIFEEAAAEDLQAAIVEPLRHERRVCLETAGP